MYVEPFLITKRVNSRSWNWHRKSRCGALNGWILISLHVITCLCGQLISIHTVSCTHENHEKTCSGRTISTFDSI